MMRAWKASASASVRRPAPRARATADEIPPPMAPPDIICISIRTGKTRVTPANASVPSLPTKYSSMSPTAACTSITSTFGAARRSRVPGIEASRSIRVRGSNRGPAPDRTTAVSAAAIVMCESEHRDGASLRLLHTARVVLLRRRHPDDGFMRVHIDAGRAGWAGTGSLKRPQAARSQDVVVQLGDGPAHHAQCAADTGGQPVAVASPGRAGLSCVHGVMLRAGRPAHKRSYAATLLASGAHLGQRRAGGGGDRLLQIVEVDGLRHVVEGTALQERSRFFVVPISADDDDGRRMRAALQVIQYRMPIDAGHLNLGGPEGGAEPAAGAKGLLAMGGDRRCGPDPGRRSFRTSAALRRLATDQHAALTVAPAEGST